MVVFILVPAGIGLLLYLLYDEASIYAKDLWSYYKETDNKSNFERQ